MVQIQCSVNIKQNPNFKCVVAIDSELGWRQVGGNLNIGRPTGNWMFSSAPNTIGLAMTNIVEHPDFSSRQNILVTMSGVIEDFLARVSRGEAMSGEGLLRTSNIVLRWEMRKQF